MEQKTFALKGNIIYTKERTRFEVMEQGWLVCEEGRVRDVYSVLPEELKGIPVEDMGDRLIIPGLTDLHIHAPQYTFRSLGMDMELLEWLETNTFPEESKYKDAEYSPATTSPQATSWLSLVCPTSPSATPCAAPPISSRCPS